MSRQPGNKLTLGKIVNGQGDLNLPTDVRDKHLHVCGSTGAGKSKFLENLIRQDIKEWRKSKCGLLLLDWHGNLYDSLMKWLAWHDFDRPIVPIDLRRQDWVVGYNPLRRREHSAASVIADNIVAAMAYVWGQDGTDQTPLFARWAANVMRALYDGGFTLHQAIDLLGGDQERRKALTAAVVDRATRRDWDYANALKTKAFEDEIGSTLNRLQRFVRNDSMQLTFGQPSASLDFSAAIEEGQIILVNLSRERNQVSPEDARMFATLLLADVWTAAQDRGKPEGDDHKPFYVYLDEFQKFITPTMAESLDQARGFGLHLTMAHQFPGQVIDSGHHGKRLWGSVMATASSKVVFRLQDQESLEPLARWLYMGVMDPDEVKRELTSTKVMGYRVEYQKAYGRAQSEEVGRASSSGGVTGSGSGVSSTGGGGNSYDAEGNLIGSSDSLSEAEAWNTYFTDTYSESESRSTSDSTSESDVPMLMPLLGKEVTSVQDRSLEEQLFRSMAVLFDQKQRQAVARLVDMKAPVSIFTPVLDRSISSPERVERYTEKLLAKLPFALPTAEAQKHLDDQQRFIETELVPSTEAVRVKEPKTVRMRVK